MAVPAQQTLMTAEELFELPNDDYKYELVQGELIRMAPTGGEHGVLTVRVGICTRRLRTRRTILVSVCGAETGFILQRNPDIVRAPDAAFIAKARIPETGIPTAYWPFAPDLAVEVTSPSDRFTAVQTKISEYFSAGTRLVWVVEPATRTVYVYRSPHDVQALGEDAELSGEDVLPGFRCAVRRLFP